MTPERREQMRAASARYKAHHLAQGLCIDCPLPATHGTHCRKHWERYKRHKRGWFDRVMKERLADGRCVNCGVKLDPECDLVNKKCVNCASSARVRPERRGRLK